MGRLTPALAARAIAQMEPHAVAAVLNAMATADVAAVLLQVYALAPHLIGPPGRCMPSPLI